MLEVIGAFDILTLRHIFVFLKKIQALSFECLKLAASFSVWRYIFRISRLRSTFEFQGHGVNLMVTVAKQWQYAALCFPRTQFNWLSVSSQWWDNLSPFHNQEGTERLQHYQGYVIVLLLSVAVCRCLFFIISLSCVCVCADNNQFFLACIARRTTVISKPQALQSIAQFDTKQDLYGKIVIVDTGYAVHHCSSMLVLLFETS